MIVRKLQLIYVTCGLLLVSLVGGLWSPSALADGLSRPAQMAQVITVTMTDDVIDNGDGRCSLREAIISANNNPNGLIPAGECAHGSAITTDQIVLQSGETYTLSIIGTDDTSEKGDLDVLNNGLKLDVALVTSGDEAATIDADLANSRIFDIHQAIMTVDNIHFQNGQVTTGATGGALRNQQGGLTVTNSQISNNEARKGGGISNFDGTVVVIDTSIVSNDDYEFGFGPGYGGGIYSEGSTALVTLQGVSFVNNRALDAGGAIYNDGGTVQFSLGETPNIFWGNQTDGDGGGIYNAGGEITGNAVELYGNMAAGTALGIYNDSTGLVDLSEFKATAHTGGISLENYGHLLLADSEIFENPGSNGIKTDNGHTTLERTVIRNNGQGINLTGQGVMTVTNSSVISNTAITGAGIRIFNSSLLMANSTVSHNKTTLGHGAALVIQGDSETDTIQFINVTISDNDSKAGSTIYSQSATLIPTLINTIVSGPPADTVCVTTQATPTLASLGNNIISDNSCLAVSQATDKIGVDPLLEPLQEMNSTFLHPITGFSPAYAAGDGPTCAAEPVNGMDQRGGSRGENCDIGAFEVPKVVLVPPDGEPGDTVIYLPIVVK